MGNHDLGGSSQVLQAAAEGVQEIIAALAGDGHHENVIGLKHHVMIRKIINKWVGMLRIIH